jgi:hypothetical protein
MGMDPPAEQNGSNKGTKLTIEAEFWPAHPRYTSQNMQMILSVSKISATVMPRVRNAPGKPHAVVVRDHC